MRCGQLLDGALVSRGDGKEESPFCLWLDVDPIRFDPIRFDPSLDVEDRANTERQSSKRVVYVQRGGPRRVESEKEKTSRVERRERERVHDPLSCAERCLLCFALLCFAFALLSRRFDSMTLGENRNWTARAFALSLSLFPAIPK